MTFILWSHVRPMMALKWDKSSTTKNYTFWVIGPACTGNTMSPKEIVKAPLNPDSIHPGFSKVDGRSPIWLYTDICKRSIELPGSIKTLLTSKLLIPGVKIKASSCDCRTRLGSIGEKVIILSIGRAPPPNKLCWMELAYSLMEVTCNSLFLFHLELYFSSMRPPWM